MPGLPASGRAVSPEGPRWTQLGRGRRLWAQQARGLAPEPGDTVRLCDPEQVVRLYPLAVATSNGRVHHEVTAGSDVAARPLWITGEEEKEVKAGRELAGEVLPGLCGQEEVSSVMEPAGGGHPPPLSLPFCCVLT